MIFLCKDCSGFIPWQSIDCSQGHTWADMIVPLNHMSVAIDMTFKGFCQNAVGIQIFMMDLWCHTE